MLTEFQAALIKLLTEAIEEMKSLSRVTISSLSGESPGPNESGEQGDSGNIKVRNAPFLSITICIPVNVGANDSTINLHHAGDDANPVSDPVVTAPPTPETIVEHDDGR